MSTSNMMYWFDNHLCLFKLTGVVRLATSYSFNMVIKQLFAEQEIQHVLIDLRDVTFIDSTNLGLLGIIARNLQMSSQQKPIIVCPDNDVYLVLQNMGFCSHFNIVHQMDMPEKTLRMIPELDGVDRQTVREAHEALMNMNDENVKKFRDVVQLLKREADSDE